MKSDISSTNSPLSSSNSKNSWRKDSAKIKNLDKIKDLENSSQSENESLVEFSRNKTLFNDLRRFKKKKVSIFTFGGEIVQGTLFSYDEVANCIVENKDKKTIVFGKAISLVSEGELECFK